MTDAAGEVGSYARRAKGAPSCGGGDSDVAGEVHSMHVRHRSIRQSRNVPCEV